MMTWDEILTALESDVFGYLSGSTEQSSVSDFSETSDASLLESTESELKQEARHYYPRPSKNRGKLPQSVVRRKIKRGAGQRGS